MGMEDWTRSLAQAVEIQIFKGQGTGQVLESGMAIDLGAIPGPNAIKHQSRQGHGQHQPV
jgi:hypothetical protein